MFTAVMWHELSLLKKKKNCTGENSKWTEWVTLQLAKLIQAKLETANMFVTLPVEINIKDTYIISWALLFNHHPFLRWSLLVYWDSNQLTISQQSTITYVAIYKYKSSCEYFSYTDCNVSKCDTKDQARRKVFFFPL